MILAIDIGNSFTNVGLFKGNKLIYKSKFPSIDKPDESKVIKIFEKFSFNFKAIGISSVVPENNPYWKAVLTNYLNVKPLFITGKTKTPLKLKIDKPQSLGSDRICNAVAGYQMYRHKHNVIIIDFGTATTYDVVLKNGDYLGGIISPGIETSSQSLFLKTSKLPLLTYRKLNFPKDPIGRNTAEAIRSGIMYPALDSMENMIRRIEKFLKVKLNVILTGGLSSLIYKKTSLNVIRKQDLVLIGINYILRYNNEH
jgi:type III pantothenate kinase